MSLHQAQLAVPNTGTYPANRRGTYKSARNSNEQKIIRTKWFVYRYYSEYAAAAKCGRAQYVPKSRWLGVPYSASHTCHAAMPCRMRAQQSASDHSRRGAKVTSKTIEGHVYAKAAHLEYAVTSDLAVFRDAVPVPVRWRAIDSPKGRVAGVLRVSASIWLRCDCFGSVVVFVYVMQLLLLISLVGCFLAVGNGGCARELMTRG